MRLTIIGCAGSFPAPTSAASCYLIQADEGGRTYSLVVDLGSGALGPLQSHLDLFDIDAIALSHLHADHISDMSGLYVYRRYHPNMPRRVAAVPVYGPFGTPTRLAQAYGLDDGEDMSREFEFRVWQPGTPVKVGPMEVSPIAVHHPIPAYGMRITGPDEAGKGMVTIGFSGDTDRCRGLDLVAAEVDLLLCEASFVTGRDTVSGVHLTGTRAGEVAASGDVGMLVLTHIPAWNHPDRARLEAQTAYEGPIVTAAPGMVFDL